MKQAILIFVSLVLASEFAYANGRGARKPHRNQSFEKNKKVERRAERGASESASQRAETSRNVERNRVIEEAIRADQKTIIRSQRENLLEVDKAAPDAKVVETLRDVARESTNLEVGSPKEAVAKLYMEIIDGFAIRSSQNKSYLDASVQGSIRDMANFGRNEVLDAVKGEGWTNRASVENLRNFLEAVKNELESGSARTLEQAVRNTEEITGIKWDKFKERCRA